MRSSPLVFFFVCAELAADAATCTKDQAKQAEREQFSSCDEYIAYYEAAAKETAKVVAAATKKRAWVAESDATVSHSDSDGHTVVGGTAVSLALSSYLEGSPSDDLTVSIFLKELYAGSGLLQDRYGSASGVTQFGIKCGAKTHLTRLTDCCSETGTQEPGLLWGTSTSYDTRSCISKSDCVREGGTMKFRWDNANGDWSYIVRDGASSYSLFKGVCRGAEPAHLYAILGSKSATLSKLQILTEEEDWKLEKMAKGATEAKAGGGSCGADYAPCGQDGQCFGVCAPNTCGPPRFCMCYPRGYWGARKGWHAGAHCLTPCLDMGKCDSKGTCSGNQAVTCT